jgi:hypothetical protein
MPKIKPIKQHSEVLRPQYFGKKHDAETNEFEAQLMALKARNRGKANNTGNTPKGAPSSASEMVMKRFLFQPGILSTNMPQKACVQMDQLIDDEIAEREFDHQQRTILESEDASRRRQHRTIPSLKAVLPNIFAILPHQSDADPLIDLNQMERSRLLRSTATDASTITLKPSVLISTLQPSFK